MADEVGLGMSALWPILREAPELLPFDTRVLQRAASFRRHVARANRHQQDTVQNAYGVLVPNRLTPEYEILMLIRMFPPPLPFGPKWVT